MNYLKAIWNKINNNTFLACVFTGATYFLLRIGTFSITENADHSFVIYPSTGIALAIALIIGMRVWPGIFIGSFLAYWVNFDFILGDAESIRHVLLAGSLTLNIILATYLVDKDDCLPDNFSNPAKTLKFFACAGMIPSLLSSTLATVINIASARRGYDTMVNDWLIWWIGDVSSVIIFTSLVFCLCTFALRRKIIVSLFLLFSFAMAEGAHHLGHNWEHQRLELIFQQQTAAITDSIENANEHYRSILQIMESVRTAPGGITRESFKNFADTILPNDPVILTVNWNAHVLHEDLAEFDATVDQEYEQDIFVGVTINGIRQELEPKDYYVMVKYIEPYETYYMAVGGDLNVNQMRNDAMQYTAINRTPSMTSPIVLYTEQEETIVSMYLASYDGDKLVGYNTVLLSLSGMLRDILAKPFSRDLDLAMTDKEAQDGLISLFSSNEELEPDASDFNLDIPMFNRVWTVDVYKKPEFYARHGSNQPFYIGFSVMVTASFLAIVVINMSGQGIYLQRLVDQRTKELEKANETKTRFMANMSHDLRTPLNAIIGFSDIIKSQLFGKLNNEKYREYIDNINRSSQYLLTLINDILDYSTIEADKRKLDKTQIDIEGCIMNCYESLYPLSNEKSISCNYNIQQDLPFLYADEKAVTQILINLISNAIKFTAKNGKITTSANFDKSHFYISVEDNGSGISKENIEKILTPFTRVENDPHLSHEGTGLGLSIVNSLMGLHDGEIKIESELDIGTKVTIKFPRENDKVIHLPLSKRRNVSA